MTLELNEAERKALAHCVKGSIQLYERYVTLRAETPSMKMRQTLAKGRLVHLLNLQTRLRR